MQSSADTDKIYLTTSSLFEDSCKLTAQVLQSGFRPNYLIALWRGGTPIGICVQEMLAYYGIETDHIAVRTSLYEGIEKRTDNIRIHGLGYFIERTTVDDSLLIVDDIFDTGLSIEAMLGEINRRARRNTPRNIKVAATWYKPAKNLTDRVPDYYVNTTEKWVVFPHELQGLRKDEIQINKPVIAKVMDELESEINILPGG